MGSMNNILFITASRIGDAVLTTGLLDYIAQTYPESKVTIACGPLCVSLFEGYSNLKEIIPVKKKSYNRHWFELWRDVSKQRWDIVVDMRNSIVSRIVFTDKRYGMGKHISRFKHKVEQAAEVMKLEEIPSPKLWFTEDQLARAQELIPYEKPILGVGPTANWIGKTWPVDRFIEVTKYLAGRGGPMEGARIAVFGAPGEEEAAYKLLSEIPKERAIDIIAKTDPGTAAACLSRCSFYLGNDSGLMHCSAAAGTPTFGVFGPSYPHLYRPWGDHTNFAQTPETFDELINFEGYDATTLKHSLMTSLEVHAVIDKLKKTFLKS